MYNVFRGICQSLHQKPDAVRPDFGEEFGSASHRARKTINKRGGVVANFALNDIGEHRKWTGNTVTSAYMALILVGQNTAKNTLPPCVNHDIS